MKKSLLAFSLLTCMLHTYSAQTQEVKVKAEVNEMAELFSVIMMLTEAPEYNLPAIYPEYRELVHAYFEPYKEHPAVLQAKKNPNTFRFHLPMGVAVNSKMENGEIVSNWYSDELKPRWTKERQEALISEMNKFYTDTDFGRFFEISHKIYEPVLESYNTLLTPKMNTNWLNEFFGSDEVRDYRLVLNYIASVCNYGVSIQNQQGPIPVSVVGIRDRDKFMEPDAEFMSDILSVTMHEYLHSYCNPLIYNLYTDFVSAGDIIYPPIKDILAKQAYGSWKNVLAEAFVRACEITYMRSDELFHEFLDAELAEQKEKGWYWVPALADLLVQYENNRDSYPTMHSFMPRIVEFYDRLAEDIKSGKRVRGDL